MITIIKGSTALNVEEIDYPIFQPEIYGSKYRVHGDEVYVNKYENPNLYCVITPRVVNGAPTTHYRLKEGNKEHTVSFKTVRNYYRSRRSGIRITLNGVTIATTSYDQLSEILRCDINGVVDAMKTVNNSRSLISIIPFGS